MASFQALLLETRRPARALLTIAGDPRHLDARIDFFSILHKLSIEPSKTHISKD
ncbi:hypothetical protein [uncultured Paludibaculum sp.]|uniref:hypothetical protein n=1 Tax=uncultured Paludibaculum sp. TaxID=1765020 RepID=UPI00374CD8A2